MQKPERKFNKQNPAGETPGQGGSEGRILNSPVTFNEGEIVAERYRIIRQLGKGGMGTVYEVVHQFTGKKFAFKVLDGQQHSDVAVRRFYQEAKAALLLDQECLVKVHDFGLLNGQQPFLVMDLISGETLASLIARKALQLDMVLRLFKQMCFGLAYAHSQGVIHRDLKPSNIIVCNFDDRQRSRPIIVDFGIAKVNTEDVQVMTLTRTGEMIGTPYYMSPEQCLGLTIDPRSDIYSLGCVLFECLAGFPPFLADSAMATMMKHHSEAPPTLQEATLGEKFPDGLQLILNRMLAKKPQDRYSSLIDVAIDLDRVKAGAPLEFGIDHLTKIGSKALSATQVVRVLAISAVAGVSFIMGLLAPHWIHGDPSHAIKQDAGQAVIDLPQDLMAVEKNAASSINSAPTVDATSTLDDKAKKRSTPPGYFSTHLPNGGVLFQFSDTPLGSLNPDGPNAKIYVCKRDGPLQLLQYESSKGRSVQAVGKILIENSRELSLVPGPWLNGNSQLFLQFRPDDIDRIRFDGITAEPLTDRDVANLVHLTGLKILDLSVLDGLSDRSFELIASLPRLESLTIQQGKISTKTLVDSPLLHRLKQFGLAGGADVDPVIEAVSKSDNLTQLEFVRCGLTKRSFELLARCHHLKCLEVSSDNSVKNEDIEPIIGKLKLSSLTLGNCDKITADVTPALMRLNAGVTHVGGARTWHWSVEDLQRRFHFGSQRIVLYKRGGFLGKEPDFERTVLEISDVQSRPAPKKPR